MMDADGIAHSFVQQYYTLQCKDPTDIHRFYLENSTYSFATEGKNDFPATGQQAIYERICSLNFSDCRTRLRQISAQLTVANSLLVQVVGELSNAGQPMRPFVQSFLLTPSAENKYFVYNSIFRYQDFVAAPVVTIPSPSPMDPVLNGEVPDYFSKPTESHAHVNGSDVAVVETPEAVAAPEPVEEVLEPQPEPAQAPAMPEPVKEPTPEPEPVPEPKQEPAKFSWATVAGTNAATNGIVKKAPAPEQTKPVVQAAAPAPAPAQQNSGRPQRRNNGATNGNASGNQASRGPVRTNGVVPDNQQIFVGGLTSNMAEEDIKAVFKSFGTAIDIKMTPKQFCFVSFDSPRIVESILAQAKTESFYLGNQRLNVEEKKERAPNSRNQGGRQNGGAPARGGRANGFARGGAPGNRGRGDSTVPQRR